MSVLWLWLTVVWFLFIVTAGGATISTTLNPTSTEGNYYGGVYFSFSVANDASGFDGETNRVWWNTSSGGSLFMQNFTQVQLSLTLGLAEAPDEMNILSVFNVYDPSKDIIGNLGSAGNTGYDESGFLFTPGVMTGGTYTMNDSSRYYDTDYGQELVSTYGFTVNISFDGSVGTGVGSWYVDYASPPADHPLHLYPTPEPSSMMLGVIGAGLLAVVCCRSKR